MSLREKLAEEIRKRKSLYIDASHKISSKPELQNEEYFASKLLSDILEKEGFSIIRGVTKRPTAFVAKKGEGSPHIAFLAEYDALPEIGHGCGHNIIGVASALAGSLASKFINKGEGTVYVYGTPAEEGGDDGSSKADFVKEGYFESIDVAMMVHPGSENTTTRSFLAVHSYCFEFFGKTSHAASAPEEGVNALDAMILFYNGINALRQQLPSDTRIHGIITHGGTAPNVIPGYTKAKFYIRAATVDRADLMLKKVQKIADGAASMTGCSVKYQAFNNTTEEMQFSPAFDALFANIAKEEGLDFKDGKNIPAGSSDIGNVSRMIPTIHPFISVTDKFVAPHTLEFMEACVSKKGDEALVKSSTLLALTALKLINSPELLDDIKKSHQNYLKRVLKNSI